MEQSDINQIEDDAEREKEQRKRNAEVTAELAKLTEEQRKAFRNIAGYGGL
jgi:hypothetical protein